jgi:amidase
MATSLATTEYFMESLLASNPWNLDPHAIPIPWRKELATPPTTRKLRLGVVFDDGVVKPQPPITRAMRETVSALRAAGHEGIQDSFSTEFHTEHVYNKIK